MTVSTTNTGSSLEIPSSYSIPEIIKKGSFGAAPKPIINGIEIIEKAPSKFYIFNPLTGIIYSYNNNFILNAVQESKSERVHIQQSFNSLNLDFYDENVKTYSISGVVVEGASMSKSNYLWASKLENYYNTQFRGTMLAKNKLLGGLSFNNVRLIGYPINFNLGHSSNNPLIVPFSMSMIVIKRLTNSLEIGSGWASYNDIDALLAQNGKEGLSDDQKKELLDKWEKMKELSEAIQEDREKYANAFLTAVTEIAELKNLQLDTGGNYLDYVLQGSLKDEKWNNGAILSYLQKKMPMHTKEFLTEVSTYLYNAHTAADNESAYLENSIKLAEAVKYINQVLYTK